MSEIFYEPHIVTNPSRPFIYHNGNCGCMPHWHENIELLFFRNDGSVVRDRTEYQVKKNDIVIFGSNMLHAVPICEEHKYDCLILDGKFCAENNIDTSSIDFDCVIRDSRAANLFCTVVCEINAFDPNKPENFSAAGTKSSILELIVYLCRKYSRPTGTTRERSDSVKRAIGYINSHISKQMSVDEIAGYAKVSKYYFCREFRRETGYTLVRYINNLRCREAERMLKSGEATVGEIARQCGYDNLSYFTRTFKAITGKSPSELKKARTL